MVFTAKTVNQLEYYRICSNNDEIVIVNPDVKKNSIAGKPLSGIEKWYSWGAFCKNRYLSMSNHFKIKIVLSCWVGWDAITGRIISQLHFFTISVEIRRT